MKLKSAGPLSVNEAEYVGFVCLWVRDGEGF
jgi:hypothetical protein